jgi:hypothetical protein
MPAPALDNQAKGDTMGDETVNGVRWPFWTISVVALIWNVMGAINFFVQLNPEVRAAYRESEQAIIEGRPGWATAAFALAVLGGTVGCSFSGSPWRLMYLSLQWLAWS